MTQANINILKIFIPEDELFYNEYDLKRAIRKYTKTYNSVIESNDKIVFHFCDGNENNVFSQAIINNKEIESYSFIEHRFGESQSTTKLKDIINMQIDNFDMFDFVQKCLCSYFSSRDSKKTGMRLSEYKRHLDFILDLAPKESSIKGKVLFDAGNANIVNENALIGQSNKCEFESDLPKSILKSSLDARLLPFNYCRVSRDSIHEALKDLQEFNSSEYNHIAIIYDLPTEFNNEVNKLCRAKSQLDSPDYQKLYRDKKKAMFTLIEKIISIQDNKSNLNVK